MKTANRQQINMRPARQLAMTGGLRQAIAFLKVDNATLTQKLRVLAKNNPALGLRIQPPAPTPPETGRIATSGLVAPPGQTEALLAAPAQGLRDHVAVEIGLAFRKAEDKRIAALFADALEPTGWLGESLSVLATRAGCSMVQAEQILARLQQIEPAGIFARDLSECLRLQAKERGLLSPAMDVLLMHLDLIARGKIQTLSELCDIDPDEVLRLIASIRRLDPKPGLVFATEDAPIRPPDVIVEHAGHEGWRVELNSATAPEIVLRTDSEDISSDAAFKEALSEARWIMHAVSRRNATVLQVVSAVVASQASFLQKGMAGMRPLTRAQVARQAGVHETTVGRVASAILVQTPQGSLPLHSFFGSALKSTQTDDGIAVQQVRQKLQELIRSENPEAPLNDAALAERLGREGIQVARRTITKYRKSLGLGSSHDRRARYRATSHSSSGRYE